MRRAGMLASCRRVSDSVDGNAGSWERVKKGSVTTGNVRGWRVRWNPLFFCWSVVILENQSGFKSATIFCQDCQQLERFRLISTSAKCGVIWLRQSNVNGKLAEHPVYPTWPWPPPHALCLCLCCVFTLGPLLHETLHLELEIGATLCSVVVLEILQDSSGVQLLGTLACGETIRIGLDIN